MSFYCIKANIFILYFTEMTLYSFFVWFQIFWLSKVSFKFLIQYKTFGSFFVTATLGIFCLLYVENPCEYLHTGKTTAPSAVGWQVMQFTVLYEGTFE